MQPRRLVVRTGWPSNRGPWASALARGMAAALCGGTLVGCAREQSLPDPDPVVRRFAAAARRGDGDAIYAMLSADAQREYGRDGVRVLVAQSALELAREGEALEKGPRTIDQVARLRLSHGEIVVLTLEGDAFKVSSAGVLPARARTPPEALAELRDALSQRSYAALIRVLSGDTGSTLDGELNGLIRGLEHPDMLEPRISGDRAEVSVPGGHWVKLRREDGVWRVEDFR
ncbi:MAG: hypothetical protein JW940_19565 [Polyangiaceae bacterium]|nr:hypothetical protein [Polyangiaceae bacterium]